MKFVENEHVVNDFNIQERIKKAEKAIVLFGAGYCDNTQRAMRILFYQLRLKFPEIDFMLEFIETSEPGRESNPESKKIYAIEKYPTVISFREGEECERQIEWTEEGLRMVAENLSKDQAKTKDQRCA